MMKTAVMVLWDRKCSGCMTVGGTDRAGSWCRGDGIEAKAVGNFAGRRAGAAVARRR